MTRTVPLLAALLLAATAVHADIGPKPTTSGLTPRPAGPDLPDVEVAMVEETVDLLLRRVREKEDRLEVRAVFRMLNQGEQATFETGFPIGPAMNFETFSVTIDGEKVDARIVERKTESGKERWYVWPGTYPGHIESTHVVEYSVKIYHRPVSPQYGGYILRTGAAWKGPIGKAKITLRVGDGITLDHFSRFLPIAGGTREEDRVEWEFTNLEPTKEHDISFYYSDSTRPEVLARARKDAERRWVSRGSVAVYLSLIPGLWLRERMTDEELSAYLDALAWIVEGWRAEGDLVVLPRKDAKGDRSYVGNPLNLLQWIDRAAAVCETYPTSERAREILKTYVYLGEKFLAEKLYAGEKRLEFEWRGKVLNDTHRAAMKKSFAKRTAKVRGWVERGRKALDEGR